MGRAGEGWERTEEEKRMGVGERRERWEPLKREGNRVKKGRE